MRIAYVYFMMEDASFGVLQKTEQQLRALQRAGISNMDILVYNPDREEQQDQLRFIKYRNPWYLPVRKLAYLFFKRQLIESSYSLEVYDAIILRHSFSDASLLRLAAEKTVIPELHSKIIEELEMKVAEGGMNLRTLIRRVRVWIEKKYLYRFIGSCAGYIVNGNELGRHIRFKVGDRPTITVFNGCDVDSIKQTGFVPFDGKELHIGFLGSRPDVWHGLDKLISSCRNYSETGGKVNVHLHFIGKMTPADLNVGDQEKNLHFHGVLRGSELDEQMAKLNVAVGPLALYRKELNETSAIKTVEYLSRGIPFIIGYDDTALMGIDELKKVYLQFPNDGEEIAMEDIINFAERTTLEREMVIQTMRNYATQKCDWSAKMRQYVEFAEQLHQQRIK